MVFRNFNRFEVPRFGNASQVPQGGRVMFPSRPGGLMELAVEGSQVGGPPGFAVVRRSRAWCMFFDKGGEAVQRSGQPLVQL